MKKKLRIHPPVQIRDAGPPGADHTAHVSGGATLLPPPNLRMGPWSVLILTRPIGTDADFRRVDRFHLTHERHLANSHGSTRAVEIRAAKSAVPGPQSDAFWSRPQHAAKEKQPVSLIYSLPHVDVHCAKGGVQIPRLDFKAARRNCGAASHSIATVYAAFLTFAASSNPCPYRAGCVLSSVRHCCETTYRVQIPSPLLRDPAGNV